MRDEAVRNAARLSLKTTANPPIRGEYSISTIYVFCSTMGTAVNNHRIGIEIYMALHYNYESNIKFKTFSLCVNAVVKWQTGDDEKIFVLILTSSLMKWC